MKHKYISTQSNELLLYFNEQNKPCFKFEEALKALPRSNRFAVIELLSDMTRRGLLMRLKEGIYYIIPYEEKSETFMPNWHLIAEYLVGDAEYYIGYYTALQIHNLITQPSLKEQIVVSKQIRPSSIKIKNVPFQFIYHSPAHFFGAKKIWIDNYNKVLCSDLEKTIIDCLYKPNYAGGIAELIKAIYKSKDKIKTNKMIEYLERFDAQVVYKRLGFLLQHLDVLKELRVEIQSMLTNSYSLLDPSLTKKGKHYSEWKIVDNIDIKSALKSIET